MKRPSSQPMTAVQAAIRQAGGVEDCSATLGVSVRTIYSWIKRGNLRGVAGEVVLRLEALSGISAEVLLDIDTRKRRRRVSLNFEGQPSNGQEKA